MKIANDYVVMKGVYKGVNGKKLTVVSVEAECIVPRNGDYAAAISSLKAGRKPLSSSQKTPP